MKPASLNGKPAILLFDSGGVVSSLIRWQTDGKVSHAGILLPDGRCLESMQGDGVRVRKLRDEEWARIEAYEVEGMTAAQWDVALNFAYRELGKGYDYWAIVRFIARSRMPDNDKWFCSELVFAAVLAAGVSLLERIEAWRVDPSRMRASPLLNHITA